MKNIVIFTDCTDIAYHELYHHLNHALRQNAIFDRTIAPMVAVKHFSVLNAAFCLRLIADCVCHSETVFLVIVHGVASNPARIFGQTKSGLTFIGNNSGYFQWLLDDFGLNVLYENHINRDMNGRSFGGKYVQVPTTVQIVSGVKFDQIGMLKEATFLNPYPIAEGTVVHIDNFGLIKIKSTFQENLKPNDLLSISINGQYRLNAKFSNKMKQEPDGTWVLYPGSSLDGLPELGCVRVQNSAALLNLNEGDKIQWSKI